MNMKTSFLFLTASIFFFSFTTFSAESNDKQKAILSYALPSTLDWKQSVDEGMDNDRQLYTLDEDASIKLISMQVANQLMWDDVVGKSKEDIFKEFSKGKKAAQKLAGYKNWTAKETLEKKSDKEIIFEMSGNYLDGKEKKFFIEKYYFTPHGFVLMSLDWTDSSKSTIVSKAKNEFKNISFKTEIK